MKRILIYGDSIPWGLIPTTKFERFAFGERWPGKLQTMLGTDYQIIEECLCARTIDSDDPRPGFEGRNAMKTLPTILDSQYPLDVIVLSLGLNEIKSIYDWTALDVAKKMGRMIDAIQERKPNFHESNPRIVLLSQPEVASTGAWGDLWVGSDEKSRELFAAYRQLAAEKGVEFIDASSVFVDAKDGVHIDAQNHGAMAELVARHLND